MRIGVVAEVSNRCEVFIENIGIRNVLMIDGKIFELMDALEAESVYRFWGMSGCGES